MRCLTWHVFYIIYSGQSFSNMSSQLDELLGKHQSGGISQGVPGAGNHGNMGMGRTDLPSLLAEIQSLTQRVEKEKFRRKHCEKQIQESQNEVRG